MNRRDAIKALTTITGATGLSVTPVTTVDAERCDLVLIKCQRHPTTAMQVAIKDAWQHAVGGTSLQDVKMLVVPPDIDIEFVKGNR